MNEIRLSKPFYDEHELTNIKEVLDSGYVTEGKVCNQLSESIKQRIGTKYCACVPNCTVALWMALKVLGIGKGDSVVVPSYTFPASAHVVTDLGAEVIFCDVDKMTYNTTYKQVEEVIAHNTKAIMPVHLFGLATPLTRLREFCEDSEIFLIEDAACSLGATVKGHQAGTMSDIGCFSFHAKKVLACGEGGAIVTDNPEIAKRLEALKRFGFDGKRDFLSPGLNFKFSDILASVGIAQMDKLDKMIEMRRGVAAYYYKTLNRDYLMPPLEPEGSKHIFQAYVVVLKEEIDRDRVIQEMKKKGVECQIGTYAVHSTSCYKQPKDGMEFIQPIHVNDQFERCPNSQFLYEHSLALPCWPGLNKSQLEQVVESLNQVLHEQDKA